MDAALKNNWIEALRSGDYEQGKPRKMDPVLKSKWLSALRGGEYEQGRGRLRNSDNHYCCLGVLADIAGKAWSPLAAPDADCYALAGVTLATSADAVGYLPDEYLDEFGIAVYHQQELALMNDSGKSFALIADEIERVL